MEKKNSNEITVKIKCDINVFYDTIEKRGFKNERIWYRKIKRRIPS